CARDALNWGFDYW
nr:immunoglobulin heavy chain junction region [Mus musculus]